MGCSTCGHTMQGLGDGRFWCPRCGTLKESGGASPDEDGLTATPPWLVLRVRHFEMAALRDLPPNPLQLWNWLGIHESVAPPDQRKET